jgi:hypothetical protein
VKTARLAAAGSLLLALSACLFPWQFLAPVSFTVVDAATGAPIPGAKVLVLACDVHDYVCRDAQLARAVSAPDGAVEVPGRRQWAIIVPVPGNIPVLNHFVAVWAPGYSAYTYGQYGDSLAGRTRNITRQDILEAFAEIPHDQRSNPLNRSSELEGGTIRLQKAAP